MLFKQLKQIVFLLLTKLDVFSTLQHENGISSFKFSEMSSTFSSNIKDNLQFAKDGGNRREDITSFDVLPFSTTQTSTAEDKSSKIEKKKDENDKVHCNQESFKLQLCVDFLQRKLLKDSTIKVKIQDLLESFVPLCLHTNGSIVRLDPRTQICCNGVVERTPYADCCEGQVFDRRTHICCNKTLHERRNETECCSTLLYNTAEYMCCNNSLPVVRKLKNMECCGQKTFNVTMQACCSDKIQPVHGVRNKKGNCCNDTSYHVDCHSCDRRSSLRPNFDESAELCCQGKIIQKIHGNASECCHRRIMNNETDTCVESEIVPKENSTVHLVMDESSTRARILLGYAGENDPSDDIMAHEGSKHVGSSETPMWIIIISSITGTVVVGSVAAFVRFAYWKFRKCRKLKRNGEHANLDMSSMLTSTEECDKSRSLLKVNLNEDDESGKECYANYIVNTESECQCLEDLDIVPPDLNLLELEYNMEKKLTINETNFIESHFIESATQTGQEHVSTRRTIFGHTFDHRLMLDESMPTLKIPGSDVSLCLPKSILESDKPEVICSSFSSLPCLRKKLDLSDAEVLASPVVEFVITGYSTLPEHARVIIPFVGDAADLIVMKFNSDEGLNTVATSIEVPVKGKQNEVLDMYYVVEGSNVIVYTTSFSGYYCKRCRHTVEDFRLRSHIFGSYKRINRKFIVAISVYIADEIFKFKDYQKRMKENEDCQERQSLKEQRLLLPNCTLNETDYIEAVLSSAEEDGWTHRLHPSTQQPINERRKEIELGLVAQTCQDSSRMNTHETEIPFCTEWNLTHTGIITPKGIVPPNEVFECTIDLNVCQKESILKKENSVLIDELVLRSKDRLAVKDDTLQGMNQPYPVQETCSPCRSNESREPSMVDPYVRRELSRPLVTSYSENNLARAEKRRPHPEVSPPASTTPHYPPLNAGIPYIADRDSPNAFNNEF